MAYERLKDIVVKDYINGKVSIKFMVGAPEIKPGQKNPNMKFISFRMIDSDKNVECKLFGADEDAIKVFVAGRIIGASIKVQEYAQGENGISCIIESYEVLDENSNEYLCREKGYESVGERLSILLDSMESEARKNIVQSIMEKYWQKYSVIPAAKGIHHKGVHGLVVHSVEVAEVALGIAEQIKSWGIETNKDVIIAGALLHDLGKVREFDISECGEADYSVESAFVNHGIIGVEIITEFMVEEKEKTALQYEFMRDIKHIMVSHHGKPEWGSPMNFCTLEAKLINVADEVSAFAKRFDNETKEMKSGECKAVKHGNEYLRFFKR